MKRMIEKKLLQWKNSKRRKPLILRGARQVGKSYSVRKFGEEYFDRVLVVDLEKNSGWHRIFEGNLDIPRIRADLEIVLKEKIVPGKTLLFLDEIQSCPRAIMALRYFFEDAPEIQVIAAGSLMEFALGSISFPVGRIQYLDLHPMNFVEFLVATGQESAAELLLSPPQSQSEVVHKFLLEELRKYLFIGGMPESVQAYVDSSSFQESFLVQKEICDSYREDFAKYAPHSDKQCLEAVFLSAARMVGKQIKYSRLAEDYSNPTIKKAFELLCKAKVIKKISSVYPEGLPLEASASSKIFKALMVDIGLMQHLCGIPVDQEFARKDLLSMYEGSLAEQLIGQEIVSAQGAQVFYWSRTARSSTAEVDFLFAKKGTIYPVEVKSGSSGRLRSMQLLLESYQNVPHGLVFSMSPYEELPEQRLLFIPLYYAFSSALSENISF